MTSPPAPCRIGSPRRRPSTAAGSMRYWTRPTRSARPSTCSLARRTRSFRKSRSARSTPSSESCGEELQAQELRGRRPRLLLRSARLVRAEGCGGCLGRAEELLRRASGMKAPQKTWSKTGTTRHKTAVGGLAGTTWHLVAPGRPLDIVVWRFRLKEDNEHGPVSKASMSSPRLSRGRSAAVSAASRAPHGPRAERRGRMPRCGGPGLETLRRRVRRHTPYA